MLSGSWAGSPSRSTPAGEGGPDGGSSGRLAPGLGRFRVARPGGRRRWRRDAWWCWVGGPGGTPCKGVRPATRLLYSGERGLDDAEVGQVRDLASPSVRWVLVRVAGTPYPEAMRGLEELLRAEGGVARVAPLGAAPGVLAASRAAGQLVEQALEVDEQLLGACVAVGGALARRRRARSRPRPGADARATPDRGAAPSGASRSA